MMLKMKWIVPIAVLFAALATYGVYRQMKTDKPVREQQTMDIQTAVVAKTKMNPGHRITSSDIHRAEWPKHLIPSNAFSSPDGVIDRVVQSTIYPGEAVLDPKLSAHGSEGGFAGIIPPGMRALTVPVDMYSGVSGFILPGTRVDVLVTVPSHSRKEDSSARMILEDVEVLAVDQTFERKGDEPVSVQSVTLLVTPKDAEKLALASTEGDLKLSLRNTSDRSKTQTTGTRLRTMMAYTPRKRTVPSGAGQKSRDWVIEIIRSNERSEVKFENALH